MPGTLTLWRPTGPAELALVRDSGWREWPPRLPEQPIFYPVLNEDYAVRIAREWNLPRDGEGHVTRFGVDAEFAARYPVRQAGGRTILELWVPAEELAEFNAHIRGPIELVRSFLPEHPGGSVPPEGGGRAPWSEFGAADDQQVGIRLGQGGHDLAEGVGEHHGLAVGVVSVLVGKVASGIEGGGHGAAGAVSGGARPPPSGVLAQPFRSP